MPPSTLRRADRVSAILERVASNGSVDAGHLADEFRVSPATIRRDLQVLEYQRLLSRTHGGAVAVDVAYELPVRYRVGQHRQEKTLVARTVADRLPKEPLVVADRSTVGRVCLAGICAVTDVATLVTDASADPAVVEAIRRLGTEVIVAGGAS